MSVRARSRAGLTVAGWVAGLIWLGQARADRKPDYVRVAYAADDAEAAALEQTLTISLRLPDLECEIRRVPAVDPRALLVPEREPRVPLARIWVDLTRSERGLLYVVDRSYSHVYIRSLARAAPAIDHAQIGEIVRSAVQALQEGAVIGIAGPGPIAPRSGAPAEPSAHATRDMRFGAGLLYGVGLRASPAVLAQGPGLYGYGLHEAHALGLGAMLTAQYQPSRIEGASARASLDTLALRAGPLLESGLSSHVALRAGLAAGVDLVHIAPSAKNGGVLADESRLATFAMLEAAVGVRARLSDHLELLASAAVEVELVDTRYVVQSVGGLAVVEDPWAIRPWLLLGIGFF